MMKEVIGQLNSSGLKIGLVVSRFNDAVTARLLDGAVDLLKRTGASEEDLVIVRVPGAFELAGTARVVAETQKVDAIVCLGCLIRGETDHYDVLASEVTRAISQVALDCSIPVAFGVITATDTEQALARAGLKAGNKGVEAAMAAVETCNVQAMLREKI